MPAPALETRVRHAAEALDAHVRDIVQWHFNPETGCEFWLNKAKGWSLPAQGSEQFRRP